MAETSPTQTLLDEIDLQQSELLWRLDKLNERVERTLREQLSRCGREEAKAA